MKTKKNLNRRDFIGMTVAGSAAVFTQSCGTLNNRNTNESPPTPQPSLRIRKNVETLNEDEKKLLKKVIRTLKDNGMWIKLAEIHKDRCSLVHKTEFFLPWHRAYLNYFEQIARQLPDCSNFTIPYWDWATSPRIPRIFGEDSEAPWDNDLDNLEPPASWSLRLNTSRTPCPTQILWWKRCPKPNADAGKLDENIRAEEIYAIIGRDRTSGFSGHLESGSHTTIHKFIEGCMEFPETAALDPLFWLHHANIDRLWSKWMENNLSKTPPPKNKFEDYANCDFPKIITDWLQSPVKVESDTSHLQVYQLIDTRRLGYIYESSPEIISWDDCPQTGKFLPGYSVKSDFDKPKTVNVNSALTVRVRAAFTTPDKLNNLQNIQNSIAEFVQHRSSSAAVASTSPSLLLTIEVEKPENSAVSVMVFINAPSNPSQLTGDSPSYVTTFSFFENIDGHHHNDNKIIESRRFIFDITETIARIENFDLADATVSICPKLLRDEGNNNAGKLNILGIGFSLTQ